MDGKAEFRDILISLVEEHSAQGMELEKRIGKAHANLRELIAFEPPRGEPEDFAVRMVRLTAIHNATVEVSLDEIQSVLHSIAAAIGVVAVGPVPEISGFKRPRPSSPEAN